MDVPRRKASLIEGLVVQIDRVASVSPRRTGTSLFTQMVAFYMDEEGEV